MTRGEQLAVGIVLFFGCAGAMYAPDFRRHVRSTIQVESKGDPAAVGDHGRSHGLAQIGYLYYLDAKKEMAKYGLVPPPYEQAVRSEYWVGQLMLYYAWHYQPRAVARGDIRTLAALHGGGPQGPKRASLRAYVKKVQAARRH